VRELRYPDYVNTEAGARFTDVEGNIYLDYLMGFEPIVLGHNEPVVREAARAQMASETVYPLTHPLEVEVAELLVDAIPSAEIVAFYMWG
tara:strand:+ start:351 stop:620 length:270 start_codon:yes stop_codon:yes gene_type:complete